MASPKTLDLRRPDTRLGERYVRCPYFPDFEGRTVEEVVAAQSLKAKKAKKAKEESDGGE